MQEINWFDELFLSTEMWGYFGPLALVILGWYLGTKDRMLSLIMFIVDCLVIAQYIALFGATPDYAWHIIILVIGGLVPCVFTMSK